MSETQRPGGLLYALGDLKPRVDPTAWIAPTAVTVTEIRSQNQLHLRCDFTESSS